jgi:hypothetical protein
MDISGADNACKYNVDQTFFCIESIQSQLRNQGRFCLVVVDRAKNIGRAILSSKQAIKTFLAVRQVTYKHLLAFPSLLPSNSPQQPSVTHALTRY